MRMARTSLFAVLSLAIATAPMIDTARAGSIPRQLYNKSITVNWGETGVYKRVSDGLTSPNTGQYQVTTYISSAGRIFVSGKSKSGSYGGSRQIGPEKTETKFEGNTLFGVSVNRGIARHLSATFDPAYSSCTGSITIGKSGPGTKVTGFDGAVYEVVSMQPGAISCSIRDGNALAN